MAKRDQWDREPVGDIVPKDNGHVFIERVCTFCGEHERDLWPGECRGGNQEQVDVWTFGPKRNDMADYEDERGKFYVDQYDPWGNLQDYLDLTGQNIEDRPWRQQ